MANENTLQRQQEYSFKEFYSKAQNIAPDLPNYIASSLMAAENQGLIDRSYYDPNGVLDEVYITVFENYRDEGNDGKLKNILYKISLARVEGLIRDEEYTPNDPSTTGILKEELDALSEKFTVDGEGEIIMQEELDDISYQQQKNRVEHIYMDESLVAQIVDRFQLENKFILAKNKRINLGILYSNIPSISRSVVELYVYGKQEEPDITEILEVEPASVQRVLKIVREKFRLI